MNIYELDEMISGLDAVKDKELIEFYKKKRVELVKQININIAKNLKK